MPFECSSLQDDLILFTKLSGRVTGDELIEYYRQIISQGKKEKYFLELLDGSRITDYQIKEDCQWRLKGFFEDFLNAIKTQICLLKQNKVDLPTLMRICPFILTNGNRNSKISKIIGLQKNHRVENPPNDPKILLKLVNYYYNSLMKCKLAMVSSDDYVYSMFKLWENQREDLGYPVKVFRDITSAATWLIVSDKKNA